MEQVVLLDERGGAIGSAAKATVHTAATPLHLAFSCYVFDGAGAVLITRRAWEKRTWPGVWSNSCCGHPAPGEALRDAVVRRLREELALRVSRVLLLLPRFRYRAVMDNGIVENEICPVLGAWTDEAPQLSAEETVAFRWIAWTEFAAAVAAGHLAVSPWCREQVRELSALGPDPRQWPEVSEERLPLAVRPREGR